MEEEELCVLFSLSNCAPPISNTDPDESFNNSIVFACKCPFTRILKKGHFHLKIHTYSSIVIPFTSIQYIKRIYEKKSASKADFSLHFII